MKPLLPMKSFFLLVLLFGLTWADQIAPMEVSAYQVWFGVAQSEPHPPMKLEHLVVLRTFFHAGQPYFLGVDPFTLQTLVRPQAGFFLRQQSLDSSALIWSSTSYFRLMASTRSSDGQLTDVGLEHVRAASGIVLTVDLCPSLKPMDRYLVRNLIAAIPATERPIPISFSISGAWIRQHPGDLHWLLGLEDSGSLAITWINHSNKHRYIPGLSWDHDFMLLPGTNVNDEVLLAEKAMLSVGIIPSVFFRFPGLVSDRKLVEQVLGLGLIPIGSDAWLAKNQQAHAGSIVLIHGNGNEPLGIQRFLQMLKNHDPEIRKNHWMLLDLEETIDDSSR